jgi:hypothetical protein
MLITSITTINKKKNKYEKAYNTAALASLPIDTIKEEGEFDLYGTTQSSNLKKIEDANCCSIF